MFRIQVSLPSGALSIGTERKDEEGALKAFAAYVRQVKTMSYITADIILSDDGVEIQREHVDNGVV